MHDTVVRMPLYLPAQGASETEAVLVEWLVQEDARFEKGQTLAQVDSAKSVYDFEAPCAGRMLRRLVAAGATASLTDPVCEIEAAEGAVRDWLPAAGASGLAVPEERSRSAPRAQAAACRTAAFLGLGSYLPQRVVTNAELTVHLPHIAPEYVEQVTGIRSRHWAAPGEKPSEMAYAAAVQAIAASGIDRAAIDAIILATTTPEAAMPSTAAFLQQRLGLPTIPAFDLNAACSGWLYGVSVAQGMLLSGAAHNVLVAAVDMQSRLLDKADESAYFLFGDAAAAGVVTLRDAGRVFGRAILGANSHGLRLARRETPGYLPSASSGNCDPYIRLDGPALFRAAVESFSTLVRQALDAAGWTPGEVRYVVPHQANARILKAAAKRSGVPFERFYLNVDRVGNCSSASIPLALAELQDRLVPGDRLILCAVGAGLTTAALAVEW